MRAKPSGSIVSPYNIESGKVIKAEPQCRIWFEQLEDGTPAVIKMYYQRGVHNFVRQKILGFRVRKEYEALKALEEIGIPCTRPLFYDYGYCRERGFFELLATREIPGATSLASTLASRPSESSDIDLAPLFQMVYTMHKGGVYHGRLSPKNILVQQTNKSQVKFFILDMPHAQLFSTSILDKTIAWYDILQLVSKLERFLGIGYCRPFLAGYGFGEMSIEQLYNDPGYYQTLSRSQRLGKILFKMKVFYSGLILQRRAKSIH